MTSWYDLMVGDKECKTDEYVRMTASEWKMTASQMIRTWSGDLRSCINYLDEIDACRGAIEPTTSAQTSPLTEEELDWRVWKDMVEEPEKYGADIGEWIELDAKVRAGPKRWRVDAYWWTKVGELNVKEAEAASKIQALWRGYQERHEVSHRFTCARCLAHGVCWLRWRDATTWICEPCALEWGAEVRKLREEEDAQEMEEDPCMCAECETEPEIYGVVGNATFCPECIHDWTECNRCTNPVRIGARCDNHCVQCEADMDDSIGQRFCTADCRAAYLWCDSVQDC